MKLAIKSAAVLLFALLVAAPTPVLAAKKLDNAFHINIRISLQCPPDDFCYYFGGWSAGGAIVKSGLIASSGKISYSSENWFRLDDGSDPGVVVFVIIRGITFETWVNEGGVSTLIGTGTATGRMWHDRITWKLKGTLGGG
ncbi:MAG: hypothetical protein ACYTEZ_02225 [Planctomycetota bacterium]|jgi:hypothetical protein